MSRTFLNDGMALKRSFALLDSGHLALLSPSCRLPVASLSLFWHF